MIISIEGLTKIYKKGSEEIKAVNDISLEIEEQSFVTIMGRSGSGKSTLLNMIGCLDKPTEGKIMIDGEHVTAIKGIKLPNIRRKKIGFIFQQSNLIPNLTALENVMLPLKYLGTPKAKAKTLAREMLESVGLSSRIKHFPSELSGGEQQRVAIARALINKPSVILADEPTGSLDTQTAKDIIDLMRDMNIKNNQTFVIATHDNIVADASDKVCKMVDGKLVS